MEVSDDRLGDNSRIFGIPISGVGSSMNDCSIGVMYYLNYLSGDTFVSVSLQVRTLYGSRMRWIRIDI